MLQLLNKYRGAKVKLFIGGVFCFTLFSAKIASAVETGIGVPKPDLSSTEKSFAGYNEYISAVYQFALVLGSSVVTLMLIYAGIKYITSQGNPSAINEAKDIVIGSLSGLALLLLAYLLLSSLGIDVV